jgi:C-terminal processing protease CtpA/Prc
VSSVGGTLGDATRQTANDLGTNSLNNARLALGASNFGGDQDYKEEIIIVNAPAGKLGVVIDTPDDGAPVVHAVKDTSVIADQVLVGDKLIAVDDDDVRSMTAIKVSKLISKKSANPNRKLTIVRTTPI